MKLLFCKQASERASERASSTLRKRRGTQTGLAHPARTMTSTDSELGGDNNGHRRRCQSAATPRRLRRHLSADGHHRAARSRCAARPDDTMGAALSASRACQSKRSGRTFCDRKRPSQGHSKPLGALAGERKFGYLQRARWEPNEGARVGPNLGGPSVWRRARLVLIGQLLAGQKPGAHNNLMANSPICPPKLRLELASAGWMFCSYFSP